jgi:hypothetical protein
MTVGGRRRVGLGARLRWVLLQDSAPVADGNVSGVGRRPSFERC